MRIFWTNIRAQTKTSSRPAWELVEELITPCCKKIKVLQSVKKGLKLGQIFYNKPSYEQDRQCTGNVTLRRVLATIVAVEKHYYIFWVCVCSRMYSSCNAHASYCYRCPIRLFSIFTFYLINGTIFEKKKVAVIKCVFLFFLQLLSEALLVVKITERDNIKIVY